MKNAGLDVKMTLLKDYIHGSHSFVYQNGVGIEDYMDGTKDSLEIFKELLG